MPRKMKESEIAERVKNAVRGMRGFRRGGVVRGSGMKPGEVPAILSNPSPVIVPPGGTFATRRNKPPHKFKGPKSGGKKVYSTGASLITVNINPPAHVPLPDKVCRAIRLRTVTLKDGVDASKAMAEYNRQRRRERKPVCVGIETERQVTETPVPWVVWHRGDKRRTFKPGIRFLHAESAG